MITMLSIIHYHLFLSFLSANLPVFHGKDKHWTGNCTDLQKEKIVKETSDSEVVIIK